MPSWYVMCWTCNGRGWVHIVPMPKYDEEGRRIDEWSTDICPDCKGSGADAKKTDAMRKKHGRY